MGGRGGEGKGVALNRSALPARSVAPAKLSGGGSCVAAVDWYRCSHDEIDYMYGKIYARFVV